MEEQSKKSQHAEREEKILKFWQENKIFEKTLAKKAPKGDFVFYEGPPTANGKPGVHHIAARVFKDAIPRYKTMCGHHVRRKAGWDTHGLAVEIEVEKRLGLKSKKEIENLGVKEFNKKCKESVLEYIDLWKQFSERMGFWTDYNDAYFTFDNNYIESLWNIVGKIDDKNLLYKDYKVLPWCARCGTALSSHELAQGYENVKDLSVTVKLKINSMPEGFVEVLGSARLPGWQRPQPDAQKSSGHSVFFLAWTTTPWTLPGNIALAAGEDIDYVLAKVNDEILILAEARLSILPEGYEILKKVKGKELVGLSYEPLYTFLKPNEKSYKVYLADFVTTNEGTGIVHTAVMYGQDDFALGTKVGLPKYHLVKEDGTFKEECGFLAGRHVKTEETDVEIIKDLAHRGLLFKKEKHEHSYPHCWRCKTPLIYYARDSWYIAMSKLRDTLVKENEKINWEPSYIREGRFGEWLREIKDWAISRERYWGTPLPVWMSEDGSEKLVVDSIETLKKHTKKSGNKYLLMRHGEAEHNVKGILTSDREAIHHLTEKGKKEALITAEKLKDEKIDVIIVSPLVRTTETAEIVKSVLGNIPMIIDKRIREEDFGVVSGTPFEKFKDYFPTFEYRLHNAPKDGESLLETRDRIGEFLYETENKYKNKNILVITHDGPASLFEVINSGVNTDEKFEKIYQPGDYLIQVGEYINFEFKPIPHNEHYELDLHKPYIDKVELLGKSGKPLKRVKEVMDVWFDSGAMPFAQDHYPFDTKNIAYPADFISEAIDQTRGWFYTLHAVGTLMGRGRAYKNVICLGHLLDKEGKKMSKSLGNVLDPWEQMDKWGVDALRLWMYSVNQPGESKNYDEKTVDEVNKKFFNLVSNVLSFYELYRDKDLEKGQTLNREKGLTLRSSHVLDKWILIKLDALVADVTKNLESYKLLEPVRAIRDFIDDLSTWYLQLSRDRFRDGDKGAKQTLYFVLKTLAKIFAPFAPFYAENLYQKLRLEGDVESVHLEEWPTSNSQGFFGKLFGKNNNKLFQDMAETRKLVSQALDARMKANIKVRQPLAKLMLEVTGLKLDQEHLDLIKDRINVKEVVYGGRNELDIVITMELKEEGIVREIIRFVQDLRKKQGLTPRDRISLSISGNEMGQKIISNPKWQKMLQDAVLAEKINLEANSGAGEHLTLENIEFFIGLTKVP